jgi:hypothetical protein
MDGWIHLCNSDQYGKKSAMNPKRGSFTPVDRNDHHDTDNGSNE